jgi:hypothetical protein
VGLVCDSVGHPGAVTSDNDELEDLAARLAALTAALTKLDEFANRIEHDNRARAGLRKTLSYLDTEGEQLLHEIAGLIAEAKIDLVTYSELRDLLTADEIDILIGDLGRRRSEIRVHIANALARPLDRTLTRRSADDQGHPEDDAVPGRLAGIAVAVGALTLASTGAGAFVALLIKESVVKKAVEGAIVGLVAAVTDKTLDALQDNRVRLRRLHRRTIVPSDNDTSRASTGVSPVWGKSREVREREFRDATWLQDEAGSGSLPDSVIHRDDPADDKDTSTDLEP